MRVTSIVIAALAGALLPASAACAGEISMNDPYLKIAAARARVEIVLRDGAIVFDTNRNTWNQNWQIMSANSQRSYSLLGQARTVEHAKGEQADRQFIQDAEKMETWLRISFDGLTQAMGQKTLLDQKFNEAGSQWSHTGNTLNQVRNMEEYWKYAKMDPNLLETVYATIEKRGVECRTQAEEAIEGLKRLKAEWDTKLADVEKFVAGRVPAAK